MLVERSIDIQEVAGSSLTAANLSPPFFVYNYTFKNFYLSAKKLTPLDLRLQDTGNIKTSFVLICLITIVIKYIIGNYLLLDKKI